jgi:hypothetical protein
MQDLLPEFLAETLESLDTELVKLERQPGDKPTSAPSSATCTP